jgi:hypothetical protein
MSKSDLGTALANLNGTPRAPSVKLLSSYANARLGAAQATDSARATLVPLIDAMEANGWKADMLRVSWIKDQPADKSAAYTAFRDSVVFATIKAMPKEAQAMMKAEKDTLSTAECRDRLIACMPNRKYWQQQSGSVVSDIMGELAKRAQAAKQSAAVEGKSEEEATAIAAQDALIERVNAIVAQAAQAIKALDKVAKAANEPADAKSRVGKLTGKLRGIVRSGADFGISE